ncbi:Trehalose-phosphatase, partial [Bienertia sinuspersici]
MSFSSHSYGVRRRAKCYCGVPIAILESWTSKNPGRRKEWMSIVGVLDDEMTEWQRDLINELLEEKKVLTSQVELMKASITRTEDENT